MKTARTHSKLPSESEAKRAKQCSDKSNSQCIAQDNTELTERVLTLEALLDQQRCEHALHLIAMKKEHKLEVLSLETRLRTTIFEANQRIFESEQIEELYEQLEEKYEDAKKRILELERNAVT